MSILYHHFQAVTRMYFINKSFMVYIFLQTFKYLYNAFDSYALQGLTYKAWTNLANIASPAFILRVGLPTRNIKGCTLIDFFVFVLGIHGCNAVYFPDRKAAGLPFRNHQVFVLLRKFQTISASHFGNLAGCCHDLKNKTFLFQYTA